MLQRRSASGDARVKALAERALKDEKAIGSGASAKAPSLNGQWASVKQSLAFPCGNLVHNYPFVHVRFLDKPWYG